MDTAPVQSINFDNALASLQTASTYELYRLSVNETEERWCVNYAILFPIIEGERSVGQQLYDRLPNR